MVQVGYTPLFGLYASLHYFWPAAIGSVNRVETHTSLYNLYVETKDYGCYERVVTKCIQCQSYLIGHFQIVVAMVQVGYTTRYRSLRNLHSLEACGPQCVNCVETSTS